MARGSTFRIGIKGQRLVDVFDPELKYEGFSLGLIGRRCLTDEMVDGLKSTLDEIHERGVYGLALHKEDIAVNEALGTASFVDFDHCHLEPGKFSNFAKNADRINLEYLIKEFKL